MKNERPDISDVALLPLTRNQFAIIDACMCECLSGFSWWTQKGSNGYYAVSQKVVNGKQEHISMESIVIGKKAGYVIDHINGNGLDNRCCNLQHITNTQNLQKGYVKKGVFSSDFKGVSRGRYLKKAGKYSWVSIIRGIYIGSFTEEKDAAIEYDKAAIREFGDYAALNFPEENGHSRCDDESIVKQVLNCQIDNTRKGK